MSENPNIEAALAYAARGWPILPLWWIEGGRCACGGIESCKPGKHPIGRLVSHGLKNATTDSATIKRWWGEYPRANVGIVTGPKSGLVVLDVDPRHGGIESWKRLGDLGQLPLTPLAQTGGDGDHILLQHPGATQKIKSRSLPGCPGIDIKADGGYIVGTPSNHISGGEYSWKIGPDTPLGQIPDWFLPLLLQEDPPRQKPAKRVEEKIPDGKRNTTLVSLAGTMRRRGMTQEAIEAALLVENKRCLPSLPKNEVVSIAKSVSKYPPGHKGDQNLKVANPTQADILLRLASVVDLFHSSEDEAYARVPVNGHIECWPLDGAGFRRWLRNTFFQEAGKACHGEALQAALQTLEAKALFAGPERPVWVRIAEHDGNIYIDLGDHAWQAVEITPRGWRVVAIPPVCFRRPKSMLALPQPESGASVKELQPFLNVASASDFILMVGFILAAMRPQGPYPIKVLNGGEGTAKSTTARVNRSLIDPNTSPLRSDPRDERTLMIAANNSWMLAYDNLSGIKKWLSDCFCRLSTGGGISDRELYTDRGENTLDAMRPVILNGIDSLTERQDLASRALIFNLPRISPKDRQTEKEFWLAFEKARPRILGALLDAVSVGLQNLENVRLSYLPRMADFALWIVACEPALPWPPGSFMAAYLGNRQEAVELSLNADVVATAIRAFMADKNELWSGTPEELHTILAKRVPENTRKSDGWPKSAPWLSRQLRRAAGFLEEVGLKIEFSKSGGRKITITRQNSSPDETSARGMDGNLDGMDGKEKIPSTRKADNHAVMDGMDGMDGNLPPSIGGTGEVKDITEVML